MKKNDFLDQFYKRRKTLIIRLLISASVVLVLMTVSLQFQKKDSFIAKISIQGIIQDRKDILNQLDELNELIKDNPDIAQIFKKQFAGTRYSSG